MRFLLSLSLVLAVSVSFAQTNTTVVFRVGIGTYSMKSQEEFQDDLRRNLGLPLREVYTFPSYPSFGGAVGFGITERFTLGLWTEYSSTGGRLSYKDYSGFVNVDQLLHLFQAGMFWQFKLGHSVKWPFFFTLHASAGRTKFSLESEIEVNGDSQKEDYPFVSGHVGLRPMFMLQHDVKMFVFQFGVGAELLSNGKLAPVEDSSLQITTSGGDDVTAQWSGVRATLGVGLKFVKEPKERPY